MTPVCNWSILRVQIWEAHGEKNVYFTAFIYTWLQKVFIEVMITLHFCFSVTMWKPAEGFEVIGDHGILSAECTTAPVTYKVKFCSCWYLFFSRTHIWRLVCSFHSAGQNLEAFRNDSETMCSHIRNSILSLYSSWRWVEKCIQVTFPLYWSLIPALRMDLENIQNNLKTNEV